MKTENIEKYATANSKYKRILSPTFKKQMPRVTSPDSKLPSHMENIFTRSSMNSISQKMLRVNKFEEGKF
jgi:hypothetical protein